MQGHKKHAQRDGKCLTAGRREEEEAWAIHHLQELETLDGLVEADVDVRRVRVDLPRRRVRDRVRALARRARAARVADPVRRGVLRGAFLAKHFCSTA